MSYFDEANMEFIEVLSCDEFDEIMERGHAEACFLFYLVLSW